MAVTPQPVAPTMLKNISVVVTQNGVDDTDSNEYADAMSSFQFVPAQAVSTWRGGTPTAVFTDISAPTWTCVIKLAQDWHTGNSFANWLLSKSGTTQKVIFKPHGNVTSAAAFAANIIVAVPPIGGDIDAWLEAGITCGVQGAPTVTIGA